MPEKQEPTSPETDRIPRTVKGFLQRVKAKHRAEKVKHRRAPSPEFVEILKNVSDDEELIDDLETRIEEAQRADAI